ncbi:MAG: sugar transferase [Bacillota bacterium]|nr:sugar transferase [Bacillota bacterium]
MYRRCIKRLLDIILALIGLILLSPVFLILMLLVRKKLGSPVLFHQERPGKDGKIFGLMKFRSMTDARDEEGNLLPDAERLPHFGKVLRATSLDELPEFINILKGDMSFVGPRPLLVRYLPYYTEEEMHRHDVRPGLTGLAQINGRNALNWEDRFRYDLTYVNNVSFAMDAKIVFGTIGKVLHHSGVQSGADQTIPDLDAYRKNAGKAAAEEVAESAGSSKERKGYNHGGA